MWVKLGGLHLQPGWCVFCMFSHKDLGKCRRLHVRRRKPAIGGVNLLDLPLILLASLLSAFLPCSVRPHQCLKAFSNWKPFFYQCWGLRKCSNYSFPRRALSGDSAANHPYGDSGSTHPPPLHLCHRLNGRPLLFAYLSDHSSKRQRWHTHKNSPWLSAPPCTVVFLDGGSERVHFVRCSVVFIDILFAFANGVFFSPSPTSFSFKNRSRSLDLSS